MYREYSTEYKEPNQYSASREEHQIKNYNPKLKERENKLCVYCSNKVHLFSNMCYQHYTNYRRTGTPFETPFKINKHIQKPVSILIDNKYYTQTLIELEQLLEKLFTNPYSFVLYQEVSGMKYSIARSKEKQAKVIKSHRIGLRTHTIALRMIMTYRHYTQGNIDGGSQLRFLLARSVFSRNKKPILGIAAFEVLGATLLGNFYTLLDKAADEMEEYYADNSGTVERPTVRW